VCGGLGDSCVVVGEGEMAGLRRTLERNSKLWALRRRRRRRWS
jgi:hypothetical protein